METGRHQGFPGGAHKVKEEEGRLNTAGRLPQCSPSPLDDPTRAESIHYAARKHGLADTDPSQVPSASSPKENKTAGRDGVFFLS